jgi:hypothetical protein
MPETHGRRAYLDLFDALAHKQGTKMVISVMNQDYVARPLEMGL